VAAEHRAPPPPPPPPLPLSASRQKRAIERIVWVESVSDSMVRGDDFIAEYVAHPALLRVFQTNKKQIEALIRSRRPSLPNHRLVAVSGFLGPSQLHHLISRSHLCVALVRRLVFQAGQQVRHPQKLATCILSRRHSFASSTKNKSPQCAATLLGHGDGIVFAVAFHSSGRILATGSSDKTAKLWLLQHDGTRHSCISTLRGHNGSVMSVAFHSSLPILATCSSDNSTRLWQLHSNFTAASCFACLQGHTDHVRSVAFHPLDSVLATGSGDSTTKLWRIHRHPHTDSMSCTELATLHGHGSCVNSVAFHPYAAVLATGSDDETAKLWRLDDYNHVTCVATLHGNKNWVLRASSIQSSNNFVLSVAFHPSSPTLATACDDGTVKLWRLNSDVTEATCVATLKGHGSSVYSVAFHPHASIMMTGSDDESAKIWRLNCDSTSAMCITTVMGHGSSVLSVAFHPRAPVVATGCYGSSAKLWR
jgi:WD40 repeat protein